MPVGVKVRMLGAGRWRMRRDAARGAAGVGGDAGKSGAGDGGYRAVAGAAKAVGALVAVDNTTATPLGQRPLELGADLSVCSDSKAMCGHSDLLMGHVAVRDAELLEQDGPAEDVGRARSWGRWRRGWRCGRCATLPLRLERMSANALAVAGFCRSGRG